MTSGIWYHIAFVVDKANSTLKLYINGAPHASAKMILNARVIDSHLYIGKMNFNTHNGLFWNGSVDDLAFFSRVLTGAEIANLYGGGRSTKLPVR